MPVELCKNPMKAFRIVGENHLSTVVEEDVNVPDMNQDLYKILNCKENASIKKCEILQDKINVSGQIAIHILYAADETGKPLSAMETTIHFEQQMEIPGAIPNMRDFCCVDIQNVECNIINSRKLNIKVIMDLDCKVEDVFDLDLPSDVRGLPDIQLLREPTEIKQVVGSQKDRYREERTINVNDENLHVGKILRCDCTLSDRDITLKDGKLEMKGNLQLQLLYLTDLEPSTAELWKTEQSVSELMEIPNAASHMDYDGDLAVSDCTVHFDGTEIKIDVIMDAYGKVYSNYVTETVVDAYSQSYQMEIAKDVFKVCELVGSGCAGTPEKETINLGANQPEIETLIYTSVRPIVGDRRLMDDKVIVEGVIEIGCIYLTSFSGEPLCSVSQEVPFKQVIDIDGTRVDMLADVKCACASVDAEMVNNQTLEIRYILNCCAHVYKNADKKILTGIVETEHSNIDFCKIPSLTIYMVQKGDTLWNIAKRYNTTVDSLAELNKIENPNKIYPGMQLLILKNIRVS